MCSKGIHQAVALITIQCRGCPLRWSHTTINMLDELKPRREVCHSNTFCVRERRNSGLFRKISTRENYNHFLNILYLRGLIQLFENSMYIGKTILIDFSYGMMLGSNIPLKKWMLCTEYIIPPAPNLYAEALTPSVCMWRWDLWKMVKLDDVL